MSKANQTNQKEEATFHCKDCGDDIPWKVIDDDEPDLEIRHFYLGREVAVDYKCRAVVQRENVERDRAIEEMARNFPGRVEIVEELPDPGRPVTKAELLAIINQHLEPKRQKRRKKK